MLQRRLVDVSDRLKRLRAELGVTNEQLVFLEGEAEDARLRALVAETPLGDVEARDAQRHADASVATVTRSSPRLPSSSVSRTASSSTACRPSCPPTDPDPTQPSEPHSVTTTRPSGAGARPRVVIAEDEAIIRLDLKELLQEEGYEVVGETGRGDEAVDLVRDLVPDLVILDVKMPGLDGLSAARHIAAERLVAVLILTVFSQRDLVEQARDAGVVVYLVKPFQKSDLIPAIEVALARHAELTSLERHVGDLEERLEARKLIDRAKGRLMDQHGMDEHASWRFIQTQAMNNRVKVQVIAQRGPDGDLSP